MPQVFWRYQRQEQCGKWRLVLHRVFYREGDWEDDQALHRSVTCGPL